MIAALQLPNVLCLIVFIAWLISLQNLYASPIVMRLFPTKDIVNSPNNESQVQPQLTTKFVQLFDADALSREDGSVGNNNPQAKPKTHGDPLPNPQPDPQPQSGPRITSRPKFIKDHMGNLVYNLWGATYGNIFQDGRFTGFYTINRIGVDSNAPKEYYPTGELETVCYDKSTVYGTPKVERWLRRNIYNHTIKSRPIWHQLRQHIFNVGKSEECHNATLYTTWKDYQECAIRRNQRLESIIPMYPMHQMGYRSSIH
ncbi:uncharacterized protein LOC116805275 [Drosophila grimshawi]|uniref:uncharacterized protein LOC116805275 n=1 Tax=Drosophila grimshawi TaxID=7222 RepID=UPI0013EF529C|nr:uncharacterized protein LOC116805275 [Drosophila grimshawi]